MAAYKYRCREKSLTKIFSMTKISDFQLPTIKKRMSAAARILLEKQTGKIILKNI